MSVKDGLTAEQVEQRKIVAARLEERRRWAEFQRIYERCVAIADVTWNDRLDAAQFAQESIAQMMRDRTEFEGTVERAIPVPLFTPRDREQFIKEVAATLLISADRRGLTAMPEPKDAETKQAPGAEAAPEAASGVAEVPGELAPT